MSGVMEPDEVRRWARMPGRDAYGTVLADIGSENPDVVILGVDSMGSCRCTKFQQRFPERSFNVGIAEANMVGIAAGLATCGKLPFANAHGFVLSMRACEQVRTDICYPNLNVKLVTSMFGLIIGTGGSTHQATEDLAIMRSFANLTVMETADGFETMKAVRAMVAHRGPVYLRVGRDSTPVHEQDCAFQIGKAIIVRRGKDATIIACGRMVAEALWAADELSQRGIETQVLDMHTIKPLDREAVIGASRGRVIVTAEEHTIIGGLGGAVAEVAGEEGLKIPVKRVGIQDTYCGIGPSNELRKRHGLTGEAIVKAVLAGMAGGA